MWWTRWQTRSWRALWWAPTAAPTPPAPRRLPKLPASKQRPPPTSSPRSARPPGRLANPPASSWGCPSVAAGHATYSFVRTPCLFAYVTAGRIATCKLASLRPQSCQLYNRTAQCTSPGTSQEMLRKYVTYAKQTCRPKLQNADYEKIAAVRSGPIPPRYSCPACSDRQVLSAATAKENYKAARHPVSVCRPAGVGSTQLHGQ